MFFRSLFIHQPKKTVNSVLVSDFIFSPRNHFSIVGLKCSTHTCERCDMCHYILKRPKKHLKNEQRSKDAAAKKRPNTSGVGKINNYYEDIYISPYNNTD